MRVNQVISHYLRDSGAGSMASVLDVDAIAVTPLLGGGEDK